MSPVPDRPCYVSGWLDANVVIRYLTGHPPEMALETAPLMREAGEGRITLHLHPVTVAEVVWVLSKGYGLDRSSVAGAVRSLLRSTGIRCRESGTIIDALDDFEHRGVDFAGALMARSAACSNAPTCYTFDARRFGRLDVDARRPG